MLHPSRALRPDPGPQRRPTNGAKVEVTKKTQPADLTLLALTKTLEAKAAWGMIHKKRKNTLNAHELLECPTNCYSENRRKKTDWFGNIKMLRTTRNFAL